MQRKYNSVFTAIHLQLLIHVELIHCSHTLLQFQSSQSNFTAILWLTYSCHYDHTLCVGFSFSYLKYWQSSRTDIQMNAEQSGRRKCYIDKCYILAAVFIALVSSVSIFSFHQPLHCIVLINVSPGDSAKKLP